LEKCNCPELATVVEVVIVVAFVDVLEVVFDVMIVEVVVV
jgi:hypothetical protein